MVATYNANKMTAGIQPKYLPSAGGVNVLSQISQTTSLNTNDLINMVQLPAKASDDPGGFGPTIIGMLLDIDKLDTGGSQQITFDVGDATTSTRFYSAVTIGQAGGYSVPTQPAVLGFQPDVNSFTSYTTASLLNYTIIAKCHLSASTWQNGKIRLLAEYTYDP